MGNHLSNPFQTEAYLKLRNEWYERLSASGFKDIERPCSREPNTLLASFDSHRFHEKFEPEFILSQQDYYYLANQFLSAFTFASQQDRDIWDLHVNGFSFRRIAQVMSFKGEKYNKDKINGIVQSLKEEMKKWKSESL